MLKSYLSYVSGSELETQILLGGDLDLIEKTTDSSRRSETSGFGQTHLLK